MIFNCDSKTSKYKTSQRGFTLIEVLITYVVLTFGLMALIKFQSSLKSHVSISQQRIEANALAQQTIERFRDFEVLDTEAGKKAYQDVATGSQSQSIGNTAFTINWTITDSTVGNPKLKRIHITVNWSDKYNANHSMQLTSIMGKIDPTFSGELITQTNNAS